MWVWVCVVGWVGVFVFLHCGKTGSVPGHMCDSRFVHQGVGLCLSAFVVAFGVVQFSGGVEEEWT